MFSLLYFAGVASFSLEVEGKEIEDTQETVAVRNLNMGILACMCYF